MASLPAPTPRIPLQVHVESTDPNLSLGVMHLEAKDTIDRSSGTSYHLIQNGSEFERSNGHTLSSVRIWKRFYWNNIIVNLKEIIRVYNH